MTLLRVVNCDIHFYLHGLISGPWSGKGGGWCFREVMDRGPSTCLFNVHSSSSVPLHQLSEMFFTLGDGRERHSSTRLMTPSSCRGAEEALVHFLISPARAHSACTRPFIHLFASGLLTLFSSWSFTFRWRTANSRPSLSECVGPRHLWRRQVPRSPDLRMKCVALQFRFLSLSVTDCGNLEGTNRMPFGSIAGHWCCRSQVGLRSQPPLTKVFMQPLIGEQ